MVGRLSGIGTLGAIAATFVTGFLLVAVRPGTESLVLEVDPGGLSVPRQLTTVEALRLVDAALADDGVYVANLIDHPPMRFVRVDRGDVVVVASRRPLPVPAIEETVSAHHVAGRPAQGRALDAFVGGAQVLTDDHAPVDQLLNPYG